MDQYTGRVKLRVRGFTRSLPMSLLNAREAVMGRFRSTLRLFNVTEQQWRVLRTLCAVESLEVLELAEATGLLAPSLSRIVSDLEERELISRKQVPHDLRRAEVSVTQRGRDLIEAMEPYSDAIYAEILEAFGKEKLEQLLGLLKDLTNELQQLPPVNLEADESSVERLRLGSPQRGRPRRSQLRAS